jgi:hypothetical protein
MCNISTAHNHFPSDEPYCIGIEPKLHHMNIHRTHNGIIIFEEILNAYYPIYVIGSKDHSLRPTL